MRASIWMVSVVALGFGAFTPRLVRAAPTSPVGNWTTIDDKTKQPKSIVTIYERGGKLYGKIIKLLAPDADPNAKCTKCSGAKKDQPMAGLVILEGLKPDGDEWSGGTILDPASGKTYKCVIKVEAPGKLKVRGYIGLSLMGRTQYWQSAGGK
ncbi:MAG TPA: DUF2147 domain-containing protein [Polyangia bacterium]|jgi:uncharacterized protein (DUF2147 family)